MKTVGTKLDNSEYEIFEFCCNEKGLTKSEQLRDLIKGFVDNKTEPFKDCTNCDEEVHNTLRKISDLLHESENYIVTEDDDGRPIEFTTYWNYD